MPISFSGVYLVFEVFQDIWHSNKENPSVILACYPVLSLDGLKLCKSVSRSDLVLDADHSLDFLRTQEAPKKMLLDPYLALQAVYLVFEVFQPKVARFCFVRAAKPAEVC